MVLSKESNQNQQSGKKLTTSTKRRIRRNILKATFKKQPVPETSGSKNTKKKLQTSDTEQVNTVKDTEDTNMSSNDKSREDVLAARQAKKLSKQKGKDKDATSENKEIVSNVVEKEINSEKPTIAAPKSKDEVDKAVINVEAPVSADKGQIKAERAAKKAAKQAKKKGVVEETPAQCQKENTAVKDVSAKPVINEDMTVKDVVETLREIANVAKEIQDVTLKVKAIELGGKKAEESNKSKAELKAERRAKQEAQRAAKQVAQDQKTVKPKVEPKEKSGGDVAKVKEASPAPKQKTQEKSKSKSQGGHRANWFQHLYTEHDKESLNSIAINSNLHPAIVKLGVQLASRVVTGGNARCVALLDALKKMVRDYTLPAKTEFGRGLEAHLAASLDFLWSMRPPSASQTNAVKFFRYHLTQLPNNVDEFDAKKTLQGEIDRYIREQIDMAGEAISIAVRNKISDGDNILIYGCSSLIERILCDAWSAGVHFRTVVSGSRVHPAGTEMLRRLVAYGLPCTYVDITALGHVMKTVSKVILGASALLANGAVVGAAGSAHAALAARARNIPVLVAAETHKFCERVHTDAFVYNEIGDPDDLIDKSDDTSPLKDWRSNPHLTPLNLTYDVTPASLITAVVTELAILPCTSAPVVLRFKLSEYGI